MRQSETGDRLGDRYLLLELLGVGGTATVFRADDERLGRPVALKVYGAVDALSDVDRRQQEARLLASLRHPSIVTLFDAHLDAEPPYLVMELVEGESLAERLRRGALPAADARPIVAAAASGLAAAHATGIVHRDVKPANILIPSIPDPAEARLVDFGIAYSLDGTRHTQAGSIVGSAVYLSPEQARGEAVTPASDVYSLGLVLIECLTGRVAFPGSAVEAIAVRLSHPPALDAPELAAHAGLLARMTAIDPADRPEAAAVAAALAEPVPTQELAPATPGGGTTAGELTTERIAAGGAAPPVAARHPRPRRPRLVLAAAGAATLLGIVALAGALIAGGVPLPGAPPEGVPAETRVTFVRPAPAEPEELVDVGNDGDPGDTGPGNGNQGNGNQGNGNQGNGNQGNGKGEGKDKKP